MDKNKKIIIIGGAIEAAILIFALVVSIIVWTTAHNAEAEHLTLEQLQELNIQDNGRMIGYFQNNPIAFFCIICIPIFVLVALDFIYFFMIASKRETNLSDEQLDQIKKQAEEEVRAELMREMLEESKKNSQTETTTDTSEK